MNMVWQCARVVSVYLHDDTVSGGLETTRHRLPLTIIPVPIAV